MQEYAERKILAKLGYRFDAQELDCATAQCFMLIESQIRRLENEEVKKSKGKMKSPGKGSRG